MTEQADHGLTFVARRRLTEASDAWLKAEEEGALTQEIVDEYYHALHALVDLNDALLLQGSEHLFRADDRRG